MRAWGFGHLAVQLVGLSAAAAMVATPVGAQRSTSSSHETPAFVSGTYTMTTVDGPFRFSGTLKISVKGGQITGISLWSCCPGPRKDPISGSVSGNHVTLVRDCRGQGSATCVSQTFVGEIGHDGRLTGTWSGDGMAKQGPYTFVVKIKPQPSLSGLVSAVKCSRSGCTQKPRAGVTVIADPVGEGTGGSTTTGNDGTYSLKLDPGTYKVSLKGLKSDPTDHQVELSDDLSGIDFNTCAGSRATASAREFISLCSFPVNVTVTGLDGQPLANVSVVADNSPTSDSSFWPETVEARTNSSGIATLQLYEATWKIQLATSILDISPPGTVDLVKQSESSSEATLPDGTPLVPNGPWYAYTQGICNGSRERGDWQDNPACVMQVKYGRDVMHPREVEFHALVVPIDVSLASGLGTGKVVLDYKSGSSTLADLQWNGEAAARNHLRFEVYKAEWRVYVVDHTAARRIAVPKDCTPGKLEPSASGIRGAQDCVLALAHANKASASFAVAT